MRQHAQQWQMGQAQSPRFSPCPLSHWSGPHVPGCHLVDRDQACLLKAQGMSTASAQIRELMYGDDAQEPRGVRGQSQDTIQLFGTHTVKPAGFFLPPFT